MSVAERYRELLERLDAWFTEASERHPGVIPCKRGCSACCLGPFDISAADMAPLEEAFRALPRRTREEVIARAREQMREVRLLEPGWEAPYDIDSIGESRFDRVCSAMVKAPCPFLDAQGACRVYRDRPLACRMMGLPMRAGRGRVIKNACPIRRQFPTYAALPPQPFPLAAFEREEEACAAEAAIQLFGPGGQAHAHLRTFIAAWVSRCQR